MSATFPRSLSALLTPRAYSHPVYVVELIETHVSWVLLTGDFAYKIKRPVRYPFVDMRSLERRSFFCSEEVRLNRRFAPDLYLEVCAITTADGEAQIGGAGEVIEHAVRMRQFSRDSELDRLLGSGRIEPPELELFGRALADLHAWLPAATVTEPWGDPARTRQQILENLAQCAQSAAVFGTTEDIEALRPSLERRVSEAEQWLSVRRAGGRVRECHGDLHTRNIVRLSAGLAAFDCMEFEPAFRWIDVADEIALLLADLEAGGYPLHMRAVLGGYLAQSGDYQSCRVLNLYKAHRALVRAKVAALTASAVNDGSVQAIRRGEHLRLIDCARRALTTPEPQLLLMCGISGSGKTWIATQLALRLGAVHLRSDVERKRGAGLPAQALSGSRLEQGLYSREVSADVYRHLVRCAEDILCGGYSAIVDATFMRCADRALFRSLATRIGVLLRIVHCAAPLATLRVRIVQRLGEGADASEADERVLKWQLRHFEPIRADEDMVTIEADTNDPEVVARLIERVRTNSETPSASDQSK